MATLKSSVVEQRLVGGLTDIFALVEQQTNIEFLVELGKNRWQIYEMLQAVYGESAMTRTILWGERLLMTMHEKGVQQPLVLMKITSRDLDIRKLCRQCDSHMAFYSPKQK